MSQIMSKFATKKLRNYVKTIKIANKINNQ